jgi:hypothetical protein
VIRYGKYGRKVSQIVKIIWKLWMKPKSAIKNIWKNMEERHVE